MPDGDVLAELGAALRGHRDRDPAAPAPQGPRIGRADDRTGPGRAQRLSTASLSTLGLPLVPSTSTSEREPPSRVPGSGAASRQRRVEELDRRDARPRSRRRRSSTAAQPVRRRRRRPQGRGAAPPAPEQAQPGRGDDPERSLDADQQRPQVVAGDVLADRAAEAHQLTRREHGLDAGTHAPVTPYRRHAGRPRCRRCSRRSATARPRPGRAGRAARSRGRGGAIVAVLTPASASIRHSCGSNERIAVQALQRDADGARRPATQPPRSPLRPPTGMIATSRS